MTVIDAFSPFPKRLFTLMATPIRVAIIGAGSMALGHIRRMLQQQDTTQIVALCEPALVSAAQAVSAGQLYRLPPEEGP